VGGRHRVRRPGFIIASQGGHRPDIAYRLTVLPLLIGSLIVLWRAGTGHPSGSAPLSGATHRNHDRPPVRRTGFDPRPRLRRRQNMICQRSR
jgi:hypothetical protein